jgi:hypothetical protein
MATTMAHFSNKRKVLQIDHFTASNEKLPEVLDLIADLIAILIG